MPFVRQGTLYQPDGSVICAVGPHTGFGDWLRLNKGFRYESLAGVEISVLKERRQGRSGEYFDYFYAHRRVFGQLMRVYLGKAEKVTVSALEYAAGRLGQIELGLGVKKERPVVRRPEGVEEKGQGQVNENAPAQRVARGESRQLELF
jgi:hypothetical protein